MLVTAILTYQCDNCTLALLEMVRFDLVPRRRGILGGWLGWLMGRGYWEYHHPMFHAWYSSIFKVSPRH